MIDPILVEKAKSGCLESRNQILVECMPIIDYVVGRLKRIKMIDDDTKRYGALLGVLAAIKNYESSKGNFEGYASVCAFRRAEREMDSDWIVRVPSDVLAKTLKEGILPYETLSTSMMFDGVESKNDQNSNFHEELSYGQEIQDTEVKQLINSCIDELQPIEREGIRYKYGYTYTSFKEIGKKYGITHQGVHSRTNAAFEVLTKKVRAKLNKNFILSNRVNYAKYQKAVVRLESLKTQKH